MKKRYLFYFLITLALLLAYAAFYFFFIISTATEDEKVLYMIPLYLLGIISAVLFTGMVFHSSLTRTNKKLEEELNQQKELINSLVNNNNEIFTSLPVGIIIYNKDSLVTYANEYSSRIFKTNTLGKDIEYLSKDLYERISNENKNEPIQIYDRKYRCDINPIKRTIYLLDVTEENDIIFKYNEIQPSLIVLSLDNIDELDSFDLKKRTDVLGQYYMAIEKWRDKYNIYSVSATGDKQSLIVNKPTLDSIIQDNFSLLSDIEGISKTLEVDLSLSIGVGTGSEDYKVLGNYADEALKFAQDRGGDQAIVYDGVKRSAFGGKVQVTERKGMFSTRLFANKLFELINKSSSVVIMPHVDTDADALGAALGVAQICEALDTPCKVLLDMDRVDATVRKIIENSSTEYIRLRQLIANEYDVEDFFVGRTLLVLVDHHGPELSPYKNVYRKAANTTIIDHHRLTENLKVEAPIKYIDHSSSSTVEIVTDIMRFLPTELHLPSFISTVMLIGMLIDTNNFSSHVGEGTFIAASKLISDDADPYRAKMYLRESVQEQSSRVKLLEKAKIVHDKFAIIIDESEEVPRENLAKSAEALLNIDNIVAGFAIGRLDKTTVGISARSNGTFNIHTEMERFGGGGHYNIGAAQIKDREINDIYNDLVKNLGNSIKGDGGNMKVILIADVKKQGKKGDIIEVSPGYGNFLLAKKMAIEANQANIAVLDEEKAMKERHQKEELEVALKLKSILEKTSVNIPVKTGEAGKFFGSVSNKQVADGLQKQCNVVIDKRKIMLPEDKIDALGSYTCTVKLHKEVAVSLTINVVEEKGE